MKNLFILVSFTILMLLVSACSTTEKQNVLRDTVPDDSSPEESVDSVAIDESTQSDLVLPIVENSTGKVLIQTVNENVPYPFTSYMITSINGEVVVVDPSMMPFMNLHLIM